MVHEVLTMLAGQMEAKDEDRLDVRDLDSLVAAVDARRAEGVSAAAACRAAGISTSTYYRRRRSGDRPAALSALALPAPAPDWPFSRGTPKAPLFWDQAFADELTDSFVRRELGAGVMRARAGRALSTLADRPPSPVRRAQAFVRRLLSGPVGAAGKPLAGLTVLLLLVLTAGWMVSVATEPAAWLPNDRAMQTVASNDG
jgi:hypothetical protein